MLETKQHKLILLQILKDIYSDISIASVLGLKGGTAAYLFYDLARFSVDLDFDLLKPEKEEEVFEKVGKILENYGELKEKRKKRNTLFFVLSYSQKTQNIKVEISIRAFPSDYQIKNYLGISMLVMRKEDTAAHKLVALLERKKLANRDLFDLWFFLKNNWEINREIVEKRTKMSFEKYLKKCANFVKKIPERHILAGLGEILDSKQKDWIKKNLKKDLLFLLELRLKV